MEYMKKIIISVIVVVALATIALFAQNQARNNVGTPNSNALIRQNSEVAAYQLYPTTNMWTFIKLNTRNGKMWQVQYSTDGNRFETYLSLTPLADRVDETNGRFTLYSTQNMWNFILLDQIDGRVWQVQWSQEAENRGVLPIKNIFE
jgi:uncharacterized protein YxeA